MHHDTVTLATSSPSDALGVIDDDDDGGGGDDDDEQSTVADEADGDTARDEESATRCVPRSQSTLLQCPVSPALLAYRCVSKTRTLFHSHLTKTKSDKQLVYAMRLLDGIARTRIARIYESAHHLADVVGYINASGISGKIANRLHVQEAVTKVLERGNLVRECHGARTKCQSHSAASAFAQPRSHFVPHGLIAQRATLNFLVRQARPRHGPLVGPPIVTSD